MSKKRVYEYAKELGLTSKEVIQKAAKLGINYQSHMAMMDEADIKKLSQPAQKREQVTKDKNPMVVADHKQQTKKNTPVNQIRGDKPMQQRENREQRSQERQQRTNRERQGERTFQNRNGERNTRPNGERAFNRNGQGRNGRDNRSNREQQQGRDNRENRPQHSNNDRPTQERRQNGDRPFNRDNRDNRGQGQRQGERAFQDRRDNGQKRNDNRNNRSQSSGVSSISATPVESIERPRANRRQAVNNNARPNYKRDEDNSKRNKQQRDKRQNNRFDEDNVRGSRKRGGKKQEAKKVMPTRKFKELPEKLIYTEGMTVADISKRIYREPSEIIKKLFLMGVMATLNQSLSADAIELLAADYGIEAEAKVIVDNTNLDSFFEAEIDEDTLVERAPVVTIMGHVDHGKTTLLDYLRKSSVIDTEAGGITQHIGAYQVDVNGRTVTFLDTPGHAAFSAMRARGADVTDITIIVVAADDGVMPQTIEAINHAKAADLPIIVAVNKIDKPEANPSRVMQELSEQGVIAEAWGGDVPFIEISAKFGQNIEELLEMILLVAEMQELKASPDRLALGSVIEAKLDPSRGAVATLLVQQGTLRVGDPIVVGNTFGRVRTMVNDHGRRVKTAIPSAPVEITGLNEAPQAGDRFVVFADEKTARAAGEERAKNALIEQRNARQHITLDNLFASLKEGELKDVNVIIKADVQGSAEALVSSLQKIEVEGVRVRIVHSAVGAINESDVTLAAASNAIIIGFNVRPTPQAKVQAEAEQVDIRQHQIIYRVIEEIETAMKGLLDPEFEEKVIGQVVVRETYKVSKVGTIAGAYVLEGHIERNCKVRVIRDNIVIHDGELASLKRFKDDVKEVKLGFECGLMLTNYNDIQIDDIIEPYIMVEIERK